MIDYTTQDRLGRFGDRWGCYATCLVNIIETEKGRRLNDDETFMAVGEMFVGEQIYMANYKDHAHPDLDTYGWSEKEDPELHFFVANQEKALKGLTDLFKLPNLRHEYVIRKLRTKYGAHFILSVDQTYDVNPDPSIEGQPVQARKVKI